MDGGENDASELLASKDDELLAAATVRANKEATQARVPSRTRQQRYERELDEWFADLATAEEQDAVTSKPDR